MTPHPSSMVRRCTALAAVGAMLWCGCSKPAAPPTNQSIESRIGLSNAGDPQLLNAVSLATLPKFGPLEAARRAHDYVTASHIDTAGCYINRVTFLEKGKVSHSSEPARPHG